MAYTSDELFHFIGHSSPYDDEKNYQVLLKILTSNCISHEPHDGTWSGVKYSTDWVEQLEAEKLIVPNITCYADIPYDDLNIHTEKYGKFGIALPKSLLIKFGARPVTYIPLRHDDWQSINGLSLLRNIESTVKSFHENVVSKTGESNDAEKIIHQIQHVLMKDFLAFVKPFHSELPESHHHNYYMEREWRKFGNMMLSANDVTRVILAKGFKPRIEKELPEYEGRVFEL